MGLRTDRAGEPALFRWEAFMALGWKLHGDGKTLGPDEVVAPDERLSWGRTVGLGAQHVVAMFGATFLVPILTGFPVSTTLFFSGVGTILFLVITRNKLPSYLGSSFAFIAPIQAYNGGKPLENKKVRTAIAERYPDDRATGFDVGDLRGALWVEVPSATPAPTGGTP